jgi:hypothetical protein
MGIAKPIPWPSLLTAALIPTASPWELMSGPPELPGLMAASVWMYESKDALKIFRPLEDTTPTVTVWSKLKGLPMAHTQSPTRIRSESPRETVGRPLDSTLRSARSVEGSDPTRRAGSSRLSASRTLTRAGPGTRWWFVRM